MENHPLKPMSELSYKDADVWKLTAGMTVSSRWTLKHIRAAVAVSPISIVYLLTVCISTALNITNLGDKEPIVYHGYTLTTKLPFREVVHAIKVAT